MQLAVWVVLSLQKGDQSSWEWAVLKSWRALEFSRNNKSQQIWMQAHHPVGSLSQLATQSQHCSGYIRGEYSQKVMEFQVSRAAQQLSWFSPASPMSSWFHMALSDFHLWWYRLLDWSQSSWCQWQRISLTAKINVVGYIYFKINYVLTKTWQESFICSYLSCWWGNYKFLLQMNRMAIHLWCMDETADWCICFFAH